jgi:hypothetical protein
MQYLRRCAEGGGVFWDQTKGIALGCPLSPIIGAFFLRELDDRLDRLGLFWVRFQDDILVLAPTWWKLRSAVKVLNPVLASLGSATHPIKRLLAESRRGSTGWAIGSAQPD